MNIKKAWWVIGGGAVSGYDTPSQLLALPKSDTEINLFWQGVGADSYTVERSTDSGYSSVTEIYSGTDKIYTDTGRTANNTYYYRVKSVKTGYNDSDWTTASSSTLIAQPAFFFEPAGAEYEGDNSFATIGGIATTPYKNSFETLKSYVNASLTFTRQTANNANFTDNSRRINSLGFSSGGAYYNGGDIVFSGDFVVCWVMKLSATLSASSYLWSNQSTTANSWFRLTNFTACQFNLGGGVQSLTWPSVTEHGFSANNLVYCIFKRAGTVASLGLYDPLTDTITWQAATAVVVTTTQTINRLFADQTTGNVLGNSDIGRMVFTATTTSDSYIKQVFKYSSAPNVTIDTKYALSTLAPKGITTWTAIPADRCIADNEINTRGSGTYKNQRVLNVGDKQFMLFHQIAANYLEDSIYVYDHTADKNSDRIDLGQLGVSTDVHGNGSIAITGTQLEHLEGVPGRANPSPFIAADTPHYDGTPTNSTRYQKSGKNFNIAEITTTPVIAGLGNKYQMREAYRRDHLYGNTRFTFAQNFDRILNYPPFVVIHKSVDNMISSVKYTVVDLQAGTTMWAYPYLVNSVGRQEMVLIINIYDTSASRFTRTAVVKCSDGTGYNWTDLDGSFTKDIRGNNPITWSEITTNCVVESATAEAGHLRVVDAHMTTGGDVYGIQGNGSGGWIFFTITSSLATYTAYDLGSSWDGKTLVDSINHEGGYVVRRSDNSYDFVMLDVNGGKWRPCEFHLTSAGGTLSFTQYLTAETTIKWDCIRGTENVGEYTNNIAVNGVRVDNGGVFANPWIIPFNE